MAKQKQVRRQKKRKRTCRLCKGCGLISNTYAGKFSNSYEFELIDKDEFEVPWSWTRDRSLIEDGSLAPVPCPECKGFKSLADEFYLIERYCCWKDANWKFVASWVNDAAARAGRLLRLCADLSHLNWQRYTSAENQTRFVSIELPGRYGGICGTTVEKGGVPCPMPIPLVESIRELRWLDTSDLPGRGETEEAFVSRHVFYEYVTVALPKKDPVTFSDPQPKVWLATTTEGEVIEFVIDSTPDKYEILRTAYDMYWACLEEGGNQDG